MRIIIGADHGGFEMKESLKEFLKQKGFQTEDKGPFEMDPEDDYPDFSKKVAEEIGKEGKEIGQEKVLGVLICRSAGGIIIACNKIKGVRGVAVYDQTQAKHAREHNDANIIGLSGDWTDQKTAQELLITSIETPYSHEERHTRRLKKIADME